MSRVFTMSLFLAVARLVPGQTDWRFAHPKPDILMNLNIGVLTRSALLTQMIEQNVPGPNQAIAAMALKTLATIDRVQVSLRMPPDGKGSPDALLLLTGELDPNIRQMLTQTSKGTVARQVAPKALLLGDALVVDQAVRRMALPAAPAFTDRLSTSDIWIGGEMAQMAMLAKTPLPQGLEALKRFSLGINFGENLEMAANLSMADAAGAGKLLAFYNMAMAQAPQTPENSKLMEGIKAEQEGPVLHFHFSAPASALQEGLAKAQGAGQLPGLMGMMFGAQPPASKEEAVPVPKPAPKPAKIMIYGLDDGPREVGAPKAKQ